MGDQSKTTGFMCLDCDQTVEAVGFCKTCSYHLCEKCYSFHTRPRKMRHHQVVGKEEMPKEQTKTETDASNDECTLLCKEHQDVLKFYCESHDLVICSECLNLHHKKCNETPKVSDITNIDTVFQANTDTLNETIKELKNVQKKSKTNLVEVGENSKTAKTDVEKFRKEFSRVSDKLAGNILRDINDIEKADQQKLENIRIACEKGIKHLTEMRKEFSALHETKRNCDLFVRVKISAEEVKAIKHQTLTDKKQNTIKQYKYMAEPRLNEVLYDVRTYGSLVNTADIEMGHGATRNRRGTSETTQRSFQVKPGHIEDEDTDVIVNSANINLQLKQGDNTVTTSIAHKAGELAQTSLDSVAAGHDPNYGDVYDADSGNLKCKRIYHVILNAFSTETSNELLMDVIKTCLQKASSSGHKSISFPALGTGVMNYPIELVAKTFLDTAMEFFSFNQSSSVVVIKIVILSGRQTDKGEDVHAVFEREMTNEGEKTGVKKLIALPNPVPPGSLEYIQYSVKERINMLLKHTDI